MHFGGAAVTCTLKLPDGTLLPFRASHRLEVTPMRNSKPGRGEAVAERLWGRSNSEERACQWRDVADRRMLALTPREHAAGRKRWRELQSDGCPALKWARAAHPNDPPARNAGLGDPRLFVGPRNRTESQHTADLAILAVWPHAHGSGSVQAWTWRVPTLTGPGSLVAEAWPVAGPRGADRGWWFRVLCPPACQS